jgi:hypothetical protein
MDPHLDPLVRGTDPRIRIRIRNKMSRIRNTARESHWISKGLEAFPGRPWEKRTIILRKEYDFLRHYFILLSQKNLGSDLSPDLD